MTTNQKIALALGFKFIPYSRLSVRRIRPAQWVYPPEWAHLRTRQPEGYIPDFTAILKDATTFAQRNAIRKDYTR